MIGPVPVIALEWRIREDIPFNLKGKLWWYCGGDSRCVMMAMRGSNGDDG